MTLVEVLVFLLLTIAAILLLSTEISLRIYRIKTSIIEIEYFPIRLILYNFLKISRQKSKNHSVKKLKRRLSLFKPSLLSLSFLIKKSAISVRSFTIGDGDERNPHRIAIKKEAERLLKDYLIVFSYTFFKESEFSQNRDLSPYKENSSTPNFDFLISTSLWCVILSFFVFIYHLIRNKGGKRKIVG